jgi:hypothetical protein
MHLYYLPDALPGYKTFLDILLVVVSISTSFVTVLFVCKFYDKLEPILNGGEESRDDKVVRLMTENRELKNENFKLKKERQEETMLLMEENDRLRNDLTGQLTQNRGGGTGFDDEFEVRTYVFLVFSCIYKMCVPEVVRESFRKTFMPIRYPH